MGQELDELDRGREHRMGWGRHAFLALRNTADLRDLRGDLRRGQHAAGTRLRALAVLHGDAFDLLFRGFLTEDAVVEPAVLRAAPEVAGPQLPDQVDRKSV